MAQPKQTDTARYDRQLRLWGEAGQSRLEESSVCLINVTATGTETLKNLVLPGIGSYTIIDGGKITEADLGNNFFLDTAHIGQSRASVACELLQELNPLVKGNHMDKDPVQLITSDINFFSTFTHIIVTDLIQSSLLLLSTFCWQNNIPLFVAKSYGFFGYLRIQVPEHTVVESKPDNPADDLRIAEPFPELAEYADKVGSKLETMNSTDHSHTPYILIMSKLYEQHGRLQQNSLPLAGVAKDKFLQLYDLIQLQNLNVKEPFGTVEEVYSELGLLNFTEITFGTYLRQNGVSESFIKQFADPITRVNYGQDSTLNALAGLISFIGSSNDLYAIKEGHNSIPKSIVEYVKPNVHLSTKVTKIIKVIEDGNTKYKVVSQDTKSNLAKEETFDYVIIAAPLDLAGIEVEVPSTLQQQREFQSTHATIVIGKVSKAFFGFQENERLPEEIFTIETPEVPFTSLALKGKLKSRDASVYKIFSRQELSDSLLDEIFEKREMTHRQPWAAYPKLQPSHKDLQIPFVLDAEKRLYYVSGMEFAFSTMESESLAGQNVANLIYKTLLK